MMYARGGRRILHQCIMFGRGGGAGATALVRRGGGCSTLRVRGLAAAEGEGGGTGKGGTTKYGATWEWAQPLVLGGGVAWASDRGEERR